MASEPDALSPTSDEGSTTKRGWGRGRKEESTESTEGVEDAAAKDNDEEDGEPKVKHGWGRSKHVDSDAEAEAEEAEAAPARKGWGRSKPSEDPEEPAALEGEDALKKPEEELQRQEVGDDKTERKDEADADNKKVNVERSKPKVPTVKITIVGATRLRPPVRREVANPYCVCEVPNKPHTKFETPVILDTIYPVWRSVHQIPELDDDDALEFTVLDAQSHRERNFLGKAVLSAERFLGVNRNSGFDGHLDLMTKDGQPFAEAQLRLKIVVGGAIPPEIGKYKSKNLSPWEVRALEAEKIPRVAPGEVLKPRGDPVYKRLYNEDQEKAKRHKERVERIEKEREDRDTELMLPFHHKKAENQEKVDDIVNRLYDEASKRQEKHQMAVKTRNDAEMEKMGPRHPTERSPDYVPIWDDDRRKNEEEMRRQKLRALRQAKLDKEDAEIEKGKLPHPRISQMDPDESVHDRLWRNANEQQKRTKQRELNEKKKIKEQSRREAPQHQDREALALTLLGVKGLSDALPDTAELQCFTNLIRARPLVQSADTGLAPESLWSNASDIARNKEPGVFEWNQEFDPVLLTEDPGSFEFRLMHGGKEVGRAEIPSNKFLNKGFEGQLDVSALEPVSQQDDQVDKKGDDDEQEAGGVDLVDEEERQGRAGPKGKADKAKAKANGKPDTDMKADDVAAVTATSADAPPPEKDNEEENQPKEDDPAQQLRKIGTLRVRIELCSDEETKHVFVRWNVNRLHDLHKQKVEKFERQRQLQQEDASKRTHPILLSECRPGSAPSSPGAPSSTGTAPSSPDKMNFGDRLYNDAHRRNAERRLRQKQELGKIQAVIESASVHKDVTAASRSWEQDQLDNVFERVYNPPPRSFQIKLGPWSAARDDLEEDELSEASAFTGTAWSSKNHLNPADAAAGGQLNLSLQSPQKSAESPKAPERRRGAIFQGRMGDDAESEEDLPLYAYYRPEATSEANMLSVPSRGKPKAGRDEAAGGTADSRAQVQRRTMRDLYYENNTTANDSMPVSNSQTASRRSNVPASGSAPKKPPHGTVAETFHNDSLSASRKSLAPASVSKKSIYSIGMDASMHSSGKKLYDQMSTASTHATSPTTSPARDKFYGLEGLSDSAEAALAEHSGSLAKSPWKKSVTGSSFGQKQQPMTGNNDTMRHPSRHVPGDLGPSPSGKMAGAAADAKLNRASSNANHYADTGKMARDQLSARSQGQQENSSFQKRQSSLQQQQTSSHTLLEATKESPRISLMPPSLGNQAPSSPQGGTATAKAKQRQSTAGKGSSKLSGPPFL